MSAFRWGQSWNPFRDLEREVEGLLSSLHFTFPSVRLGRQYPAVNFYELETEFLLTAEIPGTNPQELDVTLTGGVLTIRGKRGDVEGVAEERYRRHERFHGAWQRSISLPERVEEEGLRAEFINGILKIHLPKAAEVRPRQIPISDGSE